MALSANGGVVLVNSAADLRELAASPGLGQLQEMQIASDMLAAAASGCPNIVIGRLVVHGQQSPLDAQDLRGIRAKEVHFRQLVVAQWPQLHSETSCVMATACTIQPGTCPPWALCKHYSLTKLHIHGLQTCGARAPAAVISAPLSDVAIHMKKPSQAPRMILDGDVHSLSLSTATSLYGEDASFQSIRHLTIEVDHGCATHLYFAV